MERLAVGQFLGSVGHLDALWKKSVCSSPSTQSRPLAVQTLPNGKIYQLRVLGRIQTGQSKTDTTRFRAFCGWNWYFSSFSVSFAYRRRHKEFLYSSILPGFYLAEDYPAQLPPTSSWPKFPPLPSKGNSTPLTEKFISCSLETYFPPVPHVLCCIVLFCFLALSSTGKLNHHHLPHDNILNHKKTGLMRAPVLSTD